MDASPAFSVSMITWSYPAFSPFFNFLSAASTSHAIICGTSSGSVCYSLVAVTISLSRILLFVPRLLSCSWISLPCLPRSVVIWCLPMLCVLLTFFQALLFSIISLSFFIRGHVGNVIFGFFVSWFVLLCSSHFVGSFQSSSYL